MNLVLCYHHVSPSRTLYSTTPVVFERHLMAFRKAGYAFLSHDEMLDVARRRFVSRSKTVLVTFDDGHADNWFHARPILGSLGIPAVLFAISGAVASGPPRALDDEPVIAPTVDAEEMLMPIRWSELLEWHTTGLLSVQSHTHRHRDLRQYTGPEKPLREQLAADLAAGLDTIQDKLGERPRSLAWPWGFSSPVLRGTAAEAGLQLQFSVVPGFNGSWSASDRLHRVCLDGASEAEAEGWATRFRFWPAAAAYSIARLSLNSAKGALRGTTRRVATSAS